MFVPPELEVLKVDEDVVHKDTDQPQSDSDHAKVVEDHARTEEDHADKNDDDKALTSNESDEKSQANNKSENSECNNQNEDKTQANNLNEGKPQANNGNDFKKPPKFSLISLIITLLLSVAGLGVLYAVYDQPGSTTSEPADPTSSNNVVDPVNVVAPEPVDVNDNSLMRGPLPIVRVSPLKIGAIVMSVIVVFALIALVVYLYQSGQEKERLQMEEEERLRLELERQKELEEQRQRELEEQLQREQEDEERRREAESETRAITELILKISFVAGLLAGFAGPGMLGTSLKLVAGLIIAIVAKYWYMEQVQAFLAVTAFCSAICGLTVYVFVDISFKEGIARAVPALLIAIVVGGFGYYTA